MPAYSGGRLGWILHHGVFSFACMWIAVGFPLASTSATSHAPVLLLQCVALDSFGCTNSDDCCAVAAPGTGTYKCQKDTSASATGQCRTVRQLGCAAGLAAGLCCSLSHDAPWMQLTVACPWRLFLQAIAAGKYGCTSTSDCAPGNSCQKDSAGDTYGTCLSVCRCKPDKPPPCLTAERQLRRISYF